MTAHEQDLMQRYLYQVTRRLPRGQREEVRRELEELITDMAEAKGSIEAALTELGDPAEMARRYAGAQRCLISAEYYDSYVWLMRIVLVCSIIPVFAVSLWTGMIAAVPAQTNIVGMTVIGMSAGLTNAFVSAAQAGLSAFGAVTLVFAVIERQKVKLDLEKEKKWSVGELERESSAARPRWTPAFLSPVPDKRAVISRADSAVGVVFIVLFCALLLFSPQFFAAIVAQDDGVAFIPLFNLAQWNVILPVFALSMLLSLADEIVRLVAGYYCKIVMASSIVCNLSVIVLSAVLLKAMPLWNPDFSLQLELALDENLTGAGGLLLHWNAGAVSNAILALIVLIAVLETGVTIYKTMRYGADKT